MVLTAHSIYIYIYIYIVLEKHFLNKKTNYFLLLPQNLIKL